MRRAKKEEQKQEKLHELQAALVDKVFATEYATVKIVAVDFIDGCYYIKWMQHEWTEAATIVHELRAWIATHYQIGYYHIELTSA